MHRLPIRALLGLALLVVSWFYGRFVFGIGPGGTKGKAEGETATV